MFLENFLAEVGFAIAFVSLFGFSRYKWRSKWKVLSVMFLIMITPLYLKLKSTVPSTPLTDITFVLIWIYSIPLGSYILFKNVKITTYSLVLNNPNVSKREPTLRTNKNLSMKLKDLEKYTNVIFGVIFVFILSLFSWYQSFVLIQIPLQLIGIIAILGVAGFYYANDKNSLKRKMRVTMIAFLSSMYITMSYAFLLLTQFLFLTLSLNLIICVVLSSLMFGVFYYFVERYLLSIRDTIVSSARNKSIIEMFSKYFMRNAVIMLLLILIFSDSLLLYIIFLEENIGMMICWTTPFIYFISRFYRDTLRENSCFKIQMGLLEQTDLKNELDKLLGKKQRVTNEKA